MLTFSIPPNKAAGCLPRTTKLGEVSPLFGERIDVIPQQEWAGLITANRLLRPYVWHIYDQDGIGSCATESTSQSIALAREFGGAKRIMFNPWFIYQATSGGRDQGSTIDGNLRFIRQYGVAPESVWPRYERNQDGYPIYRNGKPIVINNWNKAPSAEAREAAKEFRLDEFYDISSIAEVGTALLKGFSVVYGWSGHSVLAVDLVDDRTLLYANSWAPTWGDKGFGKLALNEVNWSYGAFAVRTTIRNPEGRKE